jgi:hypothetical protein
MNDFILWLSAFFLLSAHLYIWDKKKKGSLRKIYIGYHNLTSSKENQIMVSEKGFIYNQNIKAKIAFATFLSVCITVIMFIIPGAMSIPLEILMFFTEIPTIVAGFYAGTILEKIYVWIGKLVGIIDKVENDETTISEEIDKVFSTNEQTKIEPHIEAQIIISDEPNQPIISEEQALNNLKNFSKHT